MSAAAAAVQPFTDGPRRRKQHHRVALVCDFFYPRLGGVENHLWSLAYHLARLGHTVIIVTHAYAGPPDEHTSTSEGEGEGEGEGGRGGRKRGRTTRRTGVRYLPGPVKVYHCPILPVIDGDALPTFTCSFPLLRHIFLRERINVVHAHQATSTLANEALLYGAELGLATVYTDHSLFGFDDVASLILNRVLKCTLSLACEVICVSHTCRDNLILRAHLSSSGGDGDGSEGAGKVHVIPNAVDPGKFTPKGEDPHDAKKDERRRRQRGGGLILPRETEEEEGEQAAAPGGSDTDDRRPLPPSTGGDEQDEGGVVRSVNDFSSSNFSGSSNHSNTGSSSASSSNEEAAADDDGDYQRKQITVVVISRLVYRKGVDLLVSLIPKICTKHPHVTFLIGGDGPKRLDLEEMVERYELQHRVTFLGSIPHSQVRDVLVRGTIFLNCSLTESFCIAILEAACAGLYVVSTNVGGVPEVLPSPELMTLSNPDAGELAAALSEAILTETGNHNRPDPWALHRRVKSMYSWGDVAHRTALVYDRARRDGAPLTFLERTARYKSVGGLAGWVSFVLGVTLHFYHLVVAWWVPVGRIDVMPDLPRAPATSAELGSCEGESGEGEGEGAT